jgi:hypothetical protein
MHYGKSKEWNYRRGTAEPPLKQYRSNSLGNRPIASKKKTAGMKQSHLREGRLLADEQHFPVLRILGPTRRNPAPEVLGPEKRE